MIKEGYFNRVHFFMEKISHGYYRISASYYGIIVVAGTTDSDAWDWLDDDSDIEKHKAALRHCYYKIRESRF